MDAFDIDGKSALDSISAGFVVRLVCIQVGPNFFRRHRIDVHIARFVECMRLLFCAIIKYQTDPGIYLVYVILKGRDYLAVSSKVRSRGTGSYIMQNVCRQYKDKKIVLLIERLDDKAENKEQRIARRKFYLKNGFTSSDIFITGASGEMEIMNFGEKVSEEAYIDLQKYALGTVMFRLSKIKVAEKTPHKKREEADQG